MRAKHHERRAVRTARALDGRELRSRLLGGSATLSVTDERRSGVVMMAIRFPLSYGVDIRNINSANLCLYENEIRTPTDSKIRTAVLTN